MELIKLSESCYYTTSDKSSDRPTLGYVKGDNMALQIDAGASKRHLEDYYHLLEQESLELPKYVVISHWHWGHSYGMSYVEGMTFSHRKTQEKLEEMSVWKWTDEAMKSRLENKEDIEFADLNIRKEYSNLNNIKVVLSDIVFEDSLEFDLGNKKVIVKYVPSPHSEDSVIVYVGEDKVVYVADAISVDYYNDNYLDKGKMKELHDILKLLDFEYCVTGHNDHVNREKILSVTKRLSQ